MIIKQKEIELPQSLPTRVVENQQTTTLLFFYPVASVENKISIGLHAEELLLSTTLTLYAVLATKFVIV